MSLYSSPFSSSIIILMNLNPRQGKGKKENINNRVKKILIVSVINERTTDKQTKKNENKNDENTSVDSLFFLLDRKNGSVNGVVLVAGEVLAPGGGGVGRVQCAGGCRRDVDGGIKDTLAIINSRRSVRIPPSHAASLYPAFSPPPHPPSPTPPFLIFTFSPQTPTPHPPFFPVCCCRFSIRVVVSAP